MNILKWFSANEKADRHMSNAKAAGDARKGNLDDRVSGVHRVVDTNLDRIERREIHRAYKARSEALKD
jgi:hypothetical protein